MGPHSSLHSILCPPLTHRDMPCPTAEQRADWEHNFDAAMVAHDKALSDLASQGDAVAQEQETRADLHRRTRALEGSPPSLPTEQQQKRPVPLLSGASILERQRQLLDAYGAAPRSQMAAALLQRAGDDGTLSDLIDSNPIGGALAGGLFGAGAGRNGLAGAGAAGLGGAGLRENAFSNFVGGDALRGRGAGDVEDFEEEEDDDDAKLESLLGSKRLGESRQERHQRKVALHAQRKAARLARNEARRHRGRGAGAGH